MIKIKNNTNQVFQLISGKTLRAYDTITVSSIDDQLRHLEKMGIVKIYY